MRDQQDYFSGFTTFWVIFKITNLTYLISQDSVRDRYSYMFAEN